MQIQALVASWGNTPNINIGGGFPTSAVILALAAVISAAIAALTAQARLRAQLQHDRELRADELDHDRAMRERDALRVTISSLATELTDVVNGALAAETAVEDLTSEDHAEPAIEAVSKAMKSLMPVYFSNGRLLLWLDNDHPLVAAHWSAGVQLHDWLKSMKNGTSPLTDDETKAMEEEHNAANEAHSEFIQQIRAWRNN
jgi:hypothetical protein